MSIATEPLRLLTSAGLLFAYLTMCLLIYRTHAGNRRVAMAPQRESNENPAWLVVFASQTGTAEDAAWQTANALHLAGIAAHVRCMSEVSADELRRAQRALFLVSTYGEGDPPDNAAVFASRLMSASVPLKQLRYAVLAFGDSGYANFCGFGRTLDQWLQRQGAQVLFERIEVDCSDAEALSDWRGRISHLAGTNDAPDWSGPAFSEWRLTQRRQLNPGSAGESVWHLELEPIGESLPDWQSGDLAQVLVPGAPDEPREYSIASIPEDGRVHLLARLRRRPDGEPGVASGWLALHAALGDSVKMRLRQHRRFRLEDNADRPLILIGNGSGIAGLRSHLKARAAKAATPNWLIFGERNAANDFHYREDIDAWQASGVLERIDMVFSRDQARRTYVQDRLREVGESLRAWVEQGAAIYVCGSLEGMAAGVHDALIELLGRDALEMLTVSGRYRRDVY